MDFSEMGNRSWRVIVKPRACFFVSKKEINTEIFVYIIFLL